MTWWWWSSSGLSRDREINVVAAAWRVWLFIWVWSGRLNGSAGRNDSVSARERAAVCNENIKKPLELIGVGVKQFHSREQKAALATKLRSWKSAILFNARPVVRKTLYAAYTVLAHIHARENFRSSANAYCALILAENRDIETRAACNFCLKTFFFLRGLLTKFLSV